MFKSFENFQKIFSFCLLEIWDIEIWNIEIWEIFSENEKYSRSQNWKISDFPNLENENIFWKFSKLLKIKFDNFFFAYSRNLNLHHVIQSPAMNSAWPVTIFRLFEFQLQQIFTHNESFSTRRWKCQDLAENQRKWRIHMWFFFQLIFFFQTKQNVFITFLSWKLH